MFVIGISFSKTVLGRFILNSNRDKVGAFFFRISLIRNSSFSNKKIFCTSKPLRNRVRRLTLIFFLLARIFANKS
jgi:hypothetical protein